MTTALERGWGAPGVPDLAAQRAYRERHIVTLRAGELDWLVRREVAPLFAHLIDRIIIPTIGPLTVRADDWSYAPRCIRGTGPGTDRPCSISNHAWGLAIDVNATQNVQGGLDPDGQFPPEFGALVDDYGFRWGGDYRSVKDPMHFEFVGTPADAARLVAELTVQGDDAVTLDEIRTALRRVLNEASVKGQENFAATIEALYGRTGAIATIATGVGKITTAVAAVKGGVDGLLSLAQNTRAEVAEIKAAVDELRARPATVPGTPYTLDEIANAVADTIHARTES